MTQEEISRATIFLVIKPIFSGDYRDEVNNLNYERKKVMIFEVYYINL